ncbi:MAG: CRISPR-associated protein Csx11 [Candidatus Altiarchaeales archaeon A3]|nr:MAG: CRISPR-associated protein Csx11 [Candidatus Altiarchaeales archaeon A3]
MISHDELKRKANEQQISVVTLERDYVIEWVLKSIYGYPQLKDILIFKGGTALKKAYFKDYRFSADLDFTAIKDVGGNILKTIFENIVKKSAEDSGISFLDIEFEQTRDEYNEEAFEIKIPFIGPTQQKNSPPKIKVQITRYEKLFFKPEEKDLISTYSDNKDCTVKLKVYSLEEIIGEKLRALHQRVRPRDLYDLYYLLTTQNINKIRVCECFLKKCEHKKVDWNIDPFEKSDDFKNAWNISLKDLISNVPDFNDVVKHVKGEMGAIKNMCRIIKNRDLILLAEIGALIHDLGKLSEEFVGYCSTEKKPESFYHAKILDPKYVPNSLINLIDSDTFEVNDLFQSTKKIKILRELIENHHHNGNSNLLKILKVPGCDGVDSGVDKGTPGKKQSKDNTFISTAFGYEKQPIKLNEFRNKFCKVLEKELIKIKNAKDVQLNWKEIRANIFESAEQEFSHALGETRRASNEVTLWDHSYSVASLYKAALAKILIDEELTDPKDLKWKILSVNFDKLKFIASSHNIPDILKRQELLENIEEGIKNFIEEEFPVGNEIYRDETGIYFVIPDLKDNSKREELKNIFTEKIIEIFQNDIEGEILPEIEISKEPSRSSVILGGVVESGKNKPPISQATIPKWKECWNENKTNKTAMFDDRLCKYADCRNYKNNACTKFKINIEICSVCGKRPKCEKQNLCKTCSKRRDKRAVEWLSKPNTTIWLDESSDLNNRVAVITARFDLSKWLNGEYLNTIFSQWFDDVNGKEE